LASFPYYLCVEAAFPRSGQSRLFDQFRVIHSFYPFSAGFVPSISMLGIALTGAWVRSHHFNAQDVHAAPGFGFLLGGRK
jgi:hypothetical protein